MCGIVGHAVSGSDELSITLAQRRQALKLLQHRGPDVFGELVRGGVWFGHTRLSILDLSSAGAQPMASGSGRHAITYNGEVYNFREIASKFRFGDLRSTSDTEVVLRLVEKLGVEAFSHLNGMFAFAAHDKRAGKLWLVRDRLGVKPLYYALDRDCLAFASEIKALMPLRGTDPTCNVPALHEWLYYGNTLGEQTLYRGVFELQPGHYLEYDLRTQAATVRSYWSLPRRPADPERVWRRREVVEQTRHLLEAAIRRQLVSDVPVGVFLSGGVDSGAIAAFAARHYGSGLCTYSASFDFSSGEGELPAARRMAERYGTDHYEFNISGADVAELVPRMVRHHDTPFADAANIPLFLMAEQVRDRTKVVLQGDGGDELFGGYRRYVTMRYRKVVRALAMLGSPVLRFVSGNAGYRMRRYANAFAAEDVATTMALLLSPEDRQADPASIFNAEFAAGLRSADPFARYLDKQAGFAEHEPINQMSLVDLSIVLPDTYLEKVDRATMAASLEVRVPFLDHELVDFVTALPPQFKTPYGKKKWLLKQALHGIVPRETLYGPKKGFGVPYGKWLLTALRPMFEDHLATFGQRQPGVLDLNVVSRSYRKAVEGEHFRLPMLWKVFNFLIWANSIRIDFQSEV